jgi:hypothetical protein
MMLKIPVMVMVDDEYSDDNDIDIFISIYR